MVVESRMDPVAGVLYNITPNGPFFSSLYELIEEAQKRPLIQNHTFDIKLGNLQTVFFMPTHTHVLLLHVKNSLFGNTTSICTNN